MENPPKGNNGKVTRPPIVVVMGHVDHGKTKILDWYRKTKVVESESGGITQHIGAYEVEHSGKKITFIDTPGHEAFSKMRSRGAKVADVGILVVAADEGVKPQTKEAVEILQQNNLAFVVAINKIDRPEANSEKVKQQLADLGVLVESYGGKIPSVEISAKTGIKMDELLEIIQLVAELQNLTTNPHGLAGGVVVEAHRDPKRGNTATLLVRDGTLHLGDFVVIGRSFETIKILEDFLGKPINEAGPSTPVLVSGLSITPFVGDTFVQFYSREKAEKYCTELPEETIVKSITVFSEKPIFNLIIKTDVVGSKEVLAESLKNIESDSISINIIRSDVGDINESDVKLALATKLVTIIGFKIKIDSAVRDLAERSNIHIVTGDVIYEVIDEAKKKIEALVPPITQRKELGKIKILKVFKQNGHTQIIGGRVDEGMLRAKKFEVRRRREAIGAGTIIELQREKIKTDTVEKGFECGLLVESKTAIEAGDLLEVYDEEIIKRVL